VAATIYIWVRTSVDWEDERAALAQVHPHVKPKIDVWNRTFDMPYHVFRHRLREIAQRNLAAVEGAVPARWDEIPEGALVVPVDDDDWFAPELATVLASEVRPGATGCYWTSSFVEVPVDLRHRLGLVRQRLVPGTPPKYLCTTNNYALVKRPDTQRFLLRHVRASAWIERHVGDEVERIDRRLSAMNRNLASQTSLGLRRTSVTRSLLVRKLRQYRRLYRRVDLAGLEWCRPYVRMMAELMDEVAIRDGR
jgi:hypothetical protein